MAQLNLIRIILVQTNAAGWSPLRSVRLPCYSVPRFGARALRTKFGIAAIVALALIAGFAAHAQAPIRERSETVSPIDGARRAADRATDALSTADQRRNAANSRYEKAQQAWAAARKEQDAAKIEQTAAESELLRAHKSAAEAREALARALDARK